jgi:hypothetical protein
VIRQPITKQGNRRHVVRKIMTKTILKEMFKKEILTERQMVTQVTVLTGKGKNLRMAYKGRNMS